MASLSNISYGNYLRQGFLTFFLIREPQYLNISTDTKLWVIDAEIGTLLRFRYLKELNIETSCQEALMSVIYIHIRDESFSDDS